MEWKGEGKKLYEEKGEVELEKGRRRRKERRLWVERLGNEVGRGERKGVLKCGGVGWAVWSALLNIAIGMLWGGLIFGYFAQKLVLLSFSQKILRREIV